VSGDGAGKNLTAENAKNINQQLNAVGVARAKTPRNAIRKRYKAAIIVVQLFLRDLCVFAVNFILNCAVRTWSWKNSPDA
jgi:hypothetical protein